MGDGGFCGKGGDWLKPRIITSILLFISSFSPLFLIFAVRDINFNKCWFKHPLLMLILLFFVVISIILLFVIFGIMKGGDIIMISSIENRSPDIINYTIPYLLAFINTDLNSLPDIISVCIFLVVLMVLTITSKSVFINPVLAMAGYGLYDIHYIYNNNDMTKTVLCKGELLVNNRYYIKTLTPFLSLIGDYDETEDT
jgi:hypothetical protein